ncbi:g12668 [Coccomyxa viridis]|uniref:G12668 protein n=1 Tax=Coccomyxa viridis TaxID=1274662 RepID=A0ABP1GBY1_9CHLO
MRLFAKQRLNGKPLLRENEPQPLAYSYHGIFLGNGMKAALEQQQRATVMSAGLTANAMRASAALQPERLRTTAVAVAQPNQSRPHCVSSIPEKPCLAAAPAAFAAQNLPAINTRSLISQHAQQHRPVQGRLQAAARPPASRLANASGHAPALPFSEAPPSIAQSVPAAAPSSWRDSWSRSEQRSSRHTSSKSRDETPLRRLEQKPHPKAPKVMTEEGAAPSSRRDSRSRSELRSSRYTSRRPRVETPPPRPKEKPHPKPLKGRLTHKPDWRKGSPEEAHKWLMYKKVLHRKKSGCEYQTMSMPSARCKNRKPLFGNKSFLLVESRLEDDPSIPSKERWAKCRRDRGLPVNGRIFPQPRRKDQGLYSKFCRFCKNFF